MKKLMVFAFLLLEASTNFVYADGCPLDGGSWEGPMLGGWLPVYTEIWQPGWLNPRESQYTSVFAGYRDPCGWLWAESPQQ